jgi:hypothetical protein
MCLPLSFSCSQAFVACFIVRFFHCPYHAFCWLSLSYAIVCCICTLIILHLYCTFYKQHYQRWCQLHQCSHQHQDWRIHVDQYVRCLSRCGRWSWLLRPAMRCCHLQRHLVHHPRWQVCCVAITEAVDTARFVVPRARVFACPPCCHCCVLTPQAHRHHCAYQGDCLRLPIRPSRLFFNVGPHWLVGHAIQLPR